MLSVQEAAGELGISRSLIYELLSSGTLRSVKARTAERIALGAPFPPAAQ
jgi:excisionase family DNA binding protein